MAGNHTYRDVRSEREGPSVDVDVLAHELKEILEKHFGNRLSLSIRDLPTPDAEAGKQPS